jgi:hemoglobin
MNGRCACTLRPRQAGEFGIQEMSPIKFDAIDEEAIQILVDSFYAKVRRDDRLGPIFEKAIGPDWSTHLQTMYRFWSSVMLTTGRYKGNPMAAHQKLPGIEPALFDRWLELFDETVDARFVEPLAASFKTKARRIAESLMLGLFYRPGHRIA